MSDEEIIIETEQEEDGRWIAEAIGFPGVLAYGSTEEEARADAREIVRILKLIFVVEN